MKRFVRLVVLMADPNCSWCGGSGTWTDPEGKSWPCIQCS